MEEPIYFENRKNAALALKDTLPIDQMRTEAWLIIAVSSGGLELGYHLNERMKLEINFLFSEGIYAPNNSECEIARVSETEEIVINDNLVNAFEIQYDYIYGEASRKHEEKILSSLYKYRKGRHFDAVKGKIILLVDEGAETGSKLMSAIKTVLGMKPKAVYVATPVMSLEVHEALEPLADEIFTLHILDDYMDTPCYYQELERVSDEKIEKILGD
ncbi:MAG: phosphoribosyltransferase [Epsilonproteobacteria bacterium]|nr:MAG: phosphoribosyltransferase [Campylobacterota bacterium]